MSYILEALRKADADRERDPSRGIHAQPVVSAGADSPAASRAMLWALAGVVLACGALAAWWFAPAANAPATVAAAPRAQAAVAQAAASPVAPPVPVAPAPAAPPEPASAVLPAPPPPPPPAPPVVQVAAMQAPAAAKPAAVPLPPAAAAPAQAAALPAAPQAPASAPAGRVLTIAELPDEVQRGLPKLAISGGVYSENASQRMLIVGGQVVNEGGEIANGLVLEQVRPKAAVLRFRGYRYAVPY